MPREANTRYAGASISNVVAYSSMGSSSQAAHTAATKQTPEALHIIDEVL